MRPPRRLFPLALAALAAGTLAACAGTQPPRPDYDPWEPLNRKVFWFNDHLDVYVLEPVARGWNFVLPNRVQVAFSDFFNNLGFPIVLVNDVLQAKPRAALEEIARVYMNTFLGGLGFVDVAARWGLPRQAEDTGQTLGYWGMAPGPYLVLPILGPSNPRDTVGLVGDTALGFYTYFITVPGITVGATAVQTVNQRSRLLKEVENAKAGSLDYYTFVRNAYVQHRYAEIHDHAAPKAEADDELYDVETYEDFLQDQE